MFNLKNVRDLGLNKGVIVETRKGVDNLLKLFKRFLKVLNVPFYDECCPEEDQPLPVGFTEADGVVRYNPETKVFETFSVGSPITIENGNSLFSTGLSGTGASSIADASNFFGEDAGNGAINASSSNFFGYKAGQGASGAIQSNFFGPNAGYQATNASQSNFFGPGAGQFCSGNNVNAFGNQAGFQNGLNGQTIFSNNCMPSFADHTAAAAAITVLLGASAGSTYLYHNQATNSIGAVRL